MRALLLALLLPLALVAVENSIVPVMEQYEQIENIPVQKYSHKQFDEIASVLAKAEDRIRVVSYNMLFNLYDQNLEETYRWPARLPRIVELLDEMEPDIIGAQELYPEQLNDLLAHIDYGFFAHKLNVIFYKKSRFELIDSKNFGHFIMLQLKDRITEKVFAFFNTHLAFSNVNKRDTQVRAICEEIKLYAKKMPVLLTGDFNIFANRLDLKTLPFYDGDYIHRLFTKEYLKDARDISILGHLGPISTFTNNADDAKPFKGLGTPGIFLDHIYVSKDVNVLIHAVQPGTVNGHFPSDHMPIVIDCIL